MFLKKTVISIKGNVQIRIKLSFAPRNMRTNLALRSQLLVSFHTKCWGIRKKTESQTR